MKQTTENLIIVYGSDDNYVKYTGITMYSLFEHNTEFDTIDVYVLDCGISEKNKQDLTSIAEQWHRCIHFIDMKEAIKGLDLHMGAKKIAIAAYARLFMGALLPDTCDRVLYMDGDTLVFDSLKPIWETEFGHALVAGVQDTVDRHYMDVIGLSHNTRYINAGMLLINLKAWREENLLQQFLALIERFGGNVPFHDQGAINAICGERRIILPVRFNVMSNLYSFSAQTIKKIYFLEEYYSQAELTEAIAKPAIVHFTTGLLGRPWEEKSTHPERENFWQVVNKTPWKGLELKPDTRGLGLKAFIFFHRVVPRPVFEFVYRNISWALHLRK